MLMIGQKNSTTAGDGAGQPAESWTVLSLLNWSTEYLADRGFGEARLNVELLLSHLLGFSRLELYMNFDRPLSRDELTGYRDLFRRRLKHEPIQYILGETEFMGLKLFVNKSVLVPRPETELLVEKVLETIPSLGKEEVSVLDVGTGSGNIAIALAHSAQNLLVTSIDVSGAALETAARNVAVHGASGVRLLEADVFSDFLPGRKFDVIVSNPPYVSKDEFMGLEPEIREYEPKLATCDGGDGYRFIRRVCAVAGEKLHDRGMLFMEIAYNQAARAKDIAEEAGLVVIELFSDYGGIPRVIKACRRPCAGKEL